jgi:hypothetical protein
MSCTATRVLLGWGAVALCAASSAAAPVDLLLRVGSFDPLRGAPPLAARLRLPAEPDAGHFIVQFERPADARTLEQLRAAGIEPLYFLPETGYVVRVPEGRKGELRARPGVRWIGAIEPGWKISPDLGLRNFVDPGRRAGSTLLVTIDLFPDEDPKRLAGRLERSGLEVLGTASFSDTRRIHARATLGEVEAIARLDAVAWVEEVGEAAPRNDDARWVVQSGQPGATPLWDRGLLGEDQIIGHIDGPIAATSCWFVDPLRAMPGPDHRKLVGYRTYGGSNGAHGTHTAGSLAGDARPTSGSLDHAGLAPDARISHTDLAGLTGLGGTPSNLYSLLMAAHLDGARVHSNSWGDDGTTSYTAWCRDADLYSYENEDALVVFAVSNSLTVRSPENAKNVLAVAASWNGLQADSLCSGGAGPTADGRRKPEITAPGCGVTSAANTTACDTALSSGTSMACPFVAAAGALVRQYFVEGRYPSGEPTPADARVPSGALIKATLLSSATDMVGAAGYPGPREGWGRLRLDDALYFAGDTRNLAVLLDARNPVGLTTGVSDLFELDVTASSEPLELTLVYTEPPAALMAAQATVNDLDLEIVAPSGRRYLGNVFDSSAGWSAPGGVPDPINNVETVLSPEPEAGRWRVRVGGTSVNSGTQGYALVATGALGEARGGALRYAAHLVDDSGPAANGNGVVDPGETVTLRIDLLNLRSSSASLVSGRLLSEAFARAAVTRALATFPDIPGSSRASSDAPHFELAIASDVPCGDALPLRVRASDASGTSDSSFALAVGNPGDPASCQPFVCGTEPAPGEVEPAVAADKDAQGQLRLSWPAVEGAAGYRLWRSADAAFETAEIAATTADLEWTAGPLPGEPALAFYRVRAVNSCGQEGP